MLQALGQQQLQPVDIGSLENLIEKQVDPRRQSIGRLGIEIELNPPRKSCAPLDKTTDGTQKGAVGFHSITQARGHHLQPGSHLIAGRPVRVFENTQIDQAMMVPDQQRSDCIASFSHEETSFSQPRKAAAAPAALSSALWLVNDVEIISLIRFS